MRTEALSRLLSSTTANGGPDISFLRAEREVVRHLLFFFVPFSLTFDLTYPNGVMGKPPSASQGILNHCFDDIESFMGKLQQTAEASTVLAQRKKKKKSKKQSAEGKKRRRRRRSRGNTFMDPDETKMCFSCVL